MSMKHPIIAVTGSSGAGTTTVKHTFEAIFHRENVNAAIVEGDSFHRHTRAEMKTLIEEAERAGLRGISHFDAKLDLVVIATLLRPAVWRTWRTAASMRSTAGPTVRSNCAPALVSSTARVWRRKRAMPTSSSSAWIWRLTADWVSASSSAAARKFRCRATQRKARQWPTPTGRVRSTGLADARVLMVQLMRLGNQ